MPFEETVLIRIYQQGRTTSYYELVAEIDVLLAKVEGQNNLVPDCPFNIRKVKDAVREAVNEKRIEFEKSGHCIAQINDYLFSFVVKVKHTDIQ